MKKKVIRTSTVAISLDVLLKGQLKFLNQEFEVIAVSGNDVHLENVAQREGVRVHSIPMQRKISPFKDLKSLVQLYLFFKKEKPDIVHSITPKAGLLSMVAAYFAGVPIRIHTFTGLIFPSKNGAMQKLLILMDRILCFFATNIFPEGQGVKDDLLQYKITSKELKIIANGNVNGVDTEYYNPSCFSEVQKNDFRKQLGVSEKDFVFLFVGRLVKDKGINELIEAYNIVVKTYQNVKLLLVGDYENELDPLKEATLKKIKELDSVITVGFQTELRSYYAIANLFVFPSYREGFPNVVLQAGAMGLPCLVTNINGSNEIIKNQNNGFIIEKANIEALKEAMCYALDHKEEITKWAKASRGLILEKYDQKVVWDAILKIYFNMH